MIDPIPHYINERESDLRKVKEGWYVLDEHGSLLSGPFSNQQRCMKISQSVKRYETRRSTENVSDSQRKAR